jgi:hypothetical protein
VVTEFHSRVKTGLVEIKVYLRRKVKEKNWFKDLANDIREEFGAKGTWKTSEEGFVWTHSQHGGKVRFLMQFDGDADFVKIWHPSRKWFELARATGDFTQWIINNASEYVRKIEIPI